ncbi:MAG: hypothetical protein ACKOAU_05290 [Pirellula sp.]
MFDAAGLAVLSEADFMLDYLRLAIALIPLGVYLSVMGLLALRKKPTLMTTGQEALLLGFAVFGFALIGPIELFFPTRAYATLGDWAWLLLAALYSLFVLLFALQRSPGWTVLGLHCEGLQALLDRALCESSIEHTWMGNQLEIPAWELRAIVEPSRGFRSTSHLTPCGKQKSLIGWYELERLFVSSKGYREARASRSPSILLGVGWLLALGMACLIAGVLFIEWDMHRVQRLIVRLLQE